VAIGGSLLGWGGRTPLVAVVLLGSSSVDAAGGVV